MEARAIEPIRRLLDYEPETGHLRWRARRKGRAPLGGVAGTLKPSGYIVVGVNGSIIRAHRVAWALAYGRWPIGDIDHVNGDRSDNRLVNLREATRAQNLQNRKRYNGASGYKGVSFNPTLNNWRAHITVSRKMIHLGSFRTPELAHAAYCDAARRLFGEFSRTT